MSRPHSVNRTTLSASLLLLAVLLQPIPASAQGVSGINAERLARIEGVLQSYIDNGELVGAVALVLQNGETVYEKAVGFSDREAGQPMTTANLFRIASQTKALTSVVILSLMEEGKLTLNDPVLRICTPRMVSVLRRVWAGTRQTRKSLSAAPWNASHPCPLSLIPESNGSMATTRTCWAVLRNVPLACRWMSSSAAALPDR